jgi:hypothetical protein
MSDVQAALAVLYRAPEGACDAEVQSRTFWWFFRHDRVTGRPKEVVLWKIWHGGFRPVETWPWTPEGCAQAGEVIYGLLATHSESGDQIRGADGLVKYGDAAADWDAWQAAVVG